MSENTIIDPIGVVTIKENGEYTNKTYAGPVELGKSFNRVTDANKEGMHLKNWKAKQVTTNDMSISVIEDSEIENLTVRGFCILKNSKIDRLHVSMFGNIFIIEGNDIYILDVDGTVHTISKASKVQHINLHPGGRVRFVTKDFALGKPKQPDYVRLDMDREWYWRLLSITHHNNASEAEYWAFG